MPTTEFACGSSLSLDWNRRDGAGGAVILGQHRNDVAPIELARIRGRPRGRSACELLLADAAVDRIPGREHRALVGLLHVARAETGARGLQSTDQGVARHRLELAGVVVAAEHPAHRAADGGE